MATAAARLAVGRRWHAPRVLRAAAIAWLAAALIWRSSEAFLQLQSPHAGGSSSQGAFAGRHDLQLRKSLRSPSAPGWSTSASSVAVEKSAAGEAAPQTGANEMSVNLAKNLVGSGILSLPSGIAAFSSSPRAVTPALALLVAAAFISAYGFWLIGRVCEKTSTSSFMGAWKKSVVKGPWLPSFVCILECFGGSVVYAMVIGDVFSSVLSLPRVTTILAIAVTVLFPLCCLRSFGALAKFSALGTAATTYVVLFVVKRFFDGSYGPGGAFYKPALQPVLDAAAPVVLDSRALILVSILSTAFLVHFNAPQFYDELEPGQGADKVASKQRNFGRVATVGFGIAAVQYAAIMTFGFLTFGSATQGNLLLNYSHKDTLANVAQAAIGLSTLTGYPMQFAGLRNGILEALGKGELPKVQHRLFTGGLLASIIAIAVLFSDLGKFQAIEGAALANFLIYVAPPLMAMRLWKGGKVRQVRYVSLIVLGLLLSVVGCKVCAHG